MTNQDRAAFVTALTVLSELPNGSLTDQRIEAYWLALQDLDLAVFQAVALAALRGCRFFPSPAELRELAEGSPEDRGQRAWAQVQHAAIHVGAYRSLDCEDLATAAALVRTFGTWTRFCTVELDPPMWANKRKEFLANYRIAQRQPADASLRCLPGLAELHNRDTVAMWGAALEPVTQTRGVLRADGAVDLEPMVLDPSSGRLLTTSEAPQLTGTVEAAPGAIDVTQLLRDAAVQRVMKALIPATRGVCASCGATWKDEAHSPECETVQAASEHEARVRRQALRLLTSTEKAL